MLFRPQTSFFVMIAAGFRAWNPHQGDWEQERTQSMLPRWHVKGALPWRGY